MLICWNLQWQRTTTQWLLPLTLTTALTFVIILLVCSNDWDSGISPLPAFRKPLQALREQKNRICKLRQRERALWAGGCFKIFSSHRLWWSIPSALQQKENFILFLKCCYYIQEICKGTLTENDQTSEPPVQQHLLSKWHFNAESQICILIKIFL